MSELANFIKNVKSRPLNFRMPAFFIKKMLGKVNRRIRSNFYWYPKSVYQALKAVQHHQANLQAVTPQFVVENFAHESTATLKLAVGSLDVREFPNWNMPFQDEEQANSLHRWGWLLHWMIDHPDRSSLRAKGLAFIYHWIQQVGLIDIGLAWESYNISERICNAILFLVFTAPDEKFDCPDDLRHVLIKMGNILANKIEYHSPLATGNHVINNARALYFLGQMLQQPQFSKLANEILRHDLTKIIQADGFSREGSSHYQFLLTRWLLEVFWVAKKSSDAEMQTFLHPTLNKVVARCRFFLVYSPLEQDWMLPLIGDVSPDFQWQWLIDLPWSALAREVNPDISQHLPPRLSGWGVLFGKNAVDVSVPTSGRTLQIFADSGWYRLDWQDLTIFWHVEKNGSPNHASHGHCDIGSFCLFWQGRPVFIDTGRFNYSCVDVLGLYGLSARAHNSVTIDQLDPFIYHQSNRYPDFYKKSNVSVEYSEDQNCFQFVIKHDGFSRIHGDKIIFQRKFFIYQTHLEIVDNFVGVKSHTLSAFFQCAPQLRIKENKSSASLSLIDEAMNFDAQLSCQFLPPLGEEVVPILLNGVTYPEISGWHFPHYGEKQPITTIKYELPRQLPCQIHYQLTWTKT